ncbi:hypothetical protein STRIP9103_01382 [Streptomyces ipomoeae 91-03]|uniref:Uncharacterized protein n=1 Tax=Streptomyces ipomoeae 91-03 TaxID=698759 RepID=L1KUE6_9ACTN|nr:hypothetical protein STRIP9103_01382 [Streptomyces ipomoeae 91-03]
MPTDTGSVHRRTRGVKNTDGNGWRRLRGAHARATADPRS